MYDGSCFADKHGWVAFTCAANPSAHESVSSGWLKAARTVQTCSSVETDAEAMEHPMQRGGREPGSPHMGPLESRT